MSSTYMTVVSCMWSKRFPTKFTLYLKEETLSSMISNQKYSDLKKNTVLKIKDFMDIQCLTTISADWLS